MSMMQMPSMQGMPQGSPYMGPRSLYGQAPSMPQMGGPSGMAGMPSAMGGPSMGSGPSMGGYNPAPSGQYPQMMGMGGASGGMGQQSQSGSGINQVGQGPRYNANGPTMDPGKMPWRQPMIGPAAGGAPGLAGYHPQPRPQVPGFGGTGPQKWMGGQGGLGGVSNLNAGGFGGPTPQNWFPPMQNGGSGSQTQQGPQMGSGPQMSPGPVAAQSPQQQSPPQQSPPQAQNPWGGFSPYQMQQMQAQQTGQGVGQTSGMPSPGGYAGGGNSGYAGGSSNFGGMGAGSLASMDPSQFGPAQQFLNGGGQFTRQNGGPQVNPFANAPQPTGGNPNGVGAPTGQVGMSAPQGWSPQQSQFGNGQTQNISATGATTTGGGGYAVPGTNPNLARLQALASQAG